MRDLTCAQVHTACLSCWNLRSHSPDRPGELLTVFVERARKQRTEGRPGTYSIVPACSRKAVQVARRGRIDAAR